MRISRLIAAIIGIIVVLLVLLKLIDSGNMPPSSYAVLNELHHDSHAYTQGITYDNNLLYETLGTETSSNLQIYSIKQQKIINSISLPKNIFGEGITVVGDKLYMASYDSHGIYVYDKQSLKPLTHIPLSKRVWGLCYNGQSTIFSDGSSTLTFVDPRTFAFEKILTVHQGHDLSLKLVI